MKTLTLIAAGLLMTASGMTASSLHLVGRSPVDHTAKVIERARVQPASAKKETIQAPHPMLGLPRNP